MYVNCVCDLLSVAPNGNRIRAPPSNEAPHRSGIRKLSHAQSLLRMRAAPKEVGCSELELPAFNAPCQQLAEVITRLRGSSLKLRKLRQAGSASPANRTPLRRSIARGSRCPRPRLASYTARRRPLANCFLIFSTMICGGLISACP